MAISDRQFFRAVREAVLDRLKLGEVPLMSRMAALVSKRLPKEQAVPTISPKHQAWRGAWNLDAMNEVFGQVDFDLSVLYDSMIDLGAANIRRLNAAESSARAQHNALDRLEAQVRNSLFIIQNGDGHFAGMFEDFSDLSKVDLESSTRDVVDLRTHSVELPKNAASTKKLDTSHLTQFSNWSFKTSVTGKLLKSSQATDAWFGNMFSDTVSMWRYDVVSDSPGASSIEFSFPVAKVSGSKLSLTRIELVSMSEFPQSAEVFYSADGINYLALPGNAGLVELNKSSVTSVLDFPSTLIQFIKIILYRDSYDKMVDGAYLTSFGLASIGLYTIGRGFSSELVSQILDIPETRVRAEKLSLSVSEQVLPKTSIDFYICPVFENDDDLYKPRNTGEWIRICPLNRTKRLDDPPRVIDFATDSVRTDTYIPETPLESMTDHETKGAKFYRLNGAVDGLYADKAITDDVVWGTANLLRGNKSWLRTKDSRQAVFRQSNCYVSFSSGNQQAVYVNTAEVVKILPAERIADANRTAIKVSRLIDNRKGMTLVPASDVDLTKDPTPNYSVSRIWLESSDDLQSEALTLSLLKPTAFTKAPIQISKTDRVDTLLFAYRAGKNNSTQLDDDLVDELESRTTLANYHGKTILKVSTIQETEDNNPNTPTLSKIRQGTSWTSGEYIEFDAEVVEISKPIPAKTKLNLNTLTDEQLLGQFGQIKVKTSLISGLSAFKTADPTTVYEAGRDFSVEYKQIDGVQKLVAMRTSSSRITSGDSVTFSFKYVSDLTRYVHSISGDTIYLDRDFGFPTAYKARVEYRFVPTGTSEALKSSLVVSSEFDGRGEVYEDGRDFYFDPKNGAIFRIHGGRIQSGESGGKTACYVNFNYKGPNSGLETFSAWAFVSSRNPARFEFEKIELDYEAGERFYVNSGVSSFDLSTATSSPDLQRGWHEFVVISKSPDINATAAIFKVIRLEDNDGEIVFLPGGKFFSELRGTRNPMTAVPIDFLKYNVAPSDHSVFAIDEDGAVVVNFQPNTQEEFFTYGYRTVTSEDPPAVIADNYPEEFEISYRYRRETSRRVRGVIVRAVLTRDGDSDASVTPKLLGYQVRVS